MTIPTRILLSVALAATLTTGAMTGAAQPAPAAGNKTFTIRVTGPHHLHFSGALDAMGADGSSDNHSVDGHTTATYTEHGMMVSVEFQKQGDNSDRLQVTIYDGHRVVKSGSTRAAFGIVMLATPLTV